MKKIVFFFVFFIFIQLTYACTCYNSYKVPMFERFNGLTEIFEGTVIKKERNNRTNLTDYYFKVEKAYKGTQDNNVIIISTGGYGCNQYFDFNSLWLVYAKDGYTTRCALNTKLDASENQNINSSISRSKILQNLNILRSTKEKDLAIETNKKGGTVAIGKLNSIKQPIGNWIYSIQEKECILTKTVSYDNGCILNKDSVKTCQ